MQKGLFVLAVGAMFVLGGCAQQPTEPVPEPQPPELVSKVAPDVLVSYENECVSRALSVRSARIVRDGVVPKLIFTIRNNVSDRYPIEYQVEWRDGDGAPIMVSKAWLRVILTGNADKAVVNMAKMKDAVSVAITIRLPREVEIFVPEVDPVQQMQQQMMQQSHEGDERLGN